MKYFLKETALFLIGGGLYFCIEMIFRGRSHWTMFICGGVCFLIIGFLNEFEERGTPLVWQMVNAAFIITGIELAFGYILNVRLGLQIWDYSNLPLNIMGQVCPQFSVLWFLVSLPAIVLDDIIRWKVFGEEKPKYTFFVWR